MSFDDLNRSSRSHQETPTARLADAITRLLQGLSPMVSERRGPFGAPTRHARLRRPGQSLCEPSGGSVWAQGRAGTQRWPSRPWCGPRPREGRAGTASRHLLTWLTTRRDRRCWGGRGQTASRRMGADVLSWPAELGLAAHESPDAPAGARGGWLEPGLLFAGLCDQVPPQLLHELRPGRVYWDCSQGSHHFQQLWKRGVVGILEEAGSAALLSRVPVEVEPDPRSIHEGATLTATNASWLAHGT